MSKINEDFYKSTEMLGDISDELEALKEQFEEGVEDFDDCTEAMGDLVNRLRTHSDVIDDTVDGMVTMFEEVLGALAG